MKRIYEILYITRFKAMILFWGSFTGYIFSLGEENYLAVGGYVLATFAFLQLLMDWNRP